jgi:hypothetical protein
MRLSQLYKFMLDLLADSSSSCYDNTRRGRDLSQGLLVLREAKD